MRIQLVCLMASMGIHVLIVCVVAAMPEREPNMELLLRLMAMTTVEPVTEFRAPVTLAIELPSATVEDFESLFDDALPEFAQEEDVIEPTMPNVQSPLAAGQDTTDVVPLEETRVVERKIENVHQDSGEAHEQDKVDEPVNVPKESTPTQSADGAAIAAGDSPGSEAAAALKAAADDAKGAVAHPIGSDPKPAASAESRSVADAKSLWQQYVQTLNQNLAKKRSYPAMAKRLKQTGTVLIEIELDRSGKLLSAQIVQSSGHKLLDDAALREVQSAVFPPFPAGIDVATRRLRLPMAYKLK